jgi:hypothetical protein
MAQAVSRRTVTVQAQPRTQASPFGISAGQSGKGQVYVRVPRFFPARVIPSVLRTNRMDKRPKPRDLQTKQRSLLSTSSDNIWICVLHVLSLRLSVSATLIISCRMRQD